MFTPLLLLAAAASSTPTNPAPGEVKTFKDWYVACDNVWSCEAGTLAAMDGDFTGAMAVRIFRDGGPNARFQITLRPGEEDAQGAAKLKIDARPAFGGVLNSDGDSWLNEKQVPGIARALANGSKAAVILSDGKAINVSLAGSSAALRYMDAVQQRAGTAGAIVATGSKSDSAQPPLTPRLTARKAPAITGLPDMKDYPAVIAATKCEYRMEGVGDSVYPLDRRGGKDLVLALIACDSGAYNFGAVAMIAERPTGDVKAKWKFSPARFDVTPSWGGEDQVTQVVNADFSPETGSLFDRSKGRGPGDCGIASNYIWDGTMFRLSERELMDECRGVWEWPRIWIAEVTVAG